MNSSLRKKKRREIGRCVHRQDYKFVDGKMKKMVLKWENKKSEKKKTRSRREEKDLKKRNGEKS